MFGIWQSSRYLKDAEELGLSRCIWDAEHAGSNPVYSTKFKTIASKGFKRTIKKGLNESMVQH